MYCLDVQRQLDDYLDGHLPASEQAAIDAHLQICTACRLRVGQARNMLLALHTMMPIQPRPGYAERVLGSLPRTAADTLPRRGIALWFGAGFATAMVALLGLWLVLAMPALDTGKNVAMVSLHVTPQQVRKVDLLFNSPVHIQQATLRIELPAGVELAGYANRRVLQWRTELKPGSNRLTLPLTATGSSHGGVLTATLSQNGKHRVFRLRILTDSASSQRVILNSSV